MKKFYELELNSLFLVGTDTYRKVGPLSYVDINNETLGEIQIDPTTASRIELIKSSKIEPCKESSDEPSEETIESDSTNPLRVVPGPECQKVHVKGRAKDIVLTMTMGDDGDSVTSIIMDHVNEVVVYDAPKSIKTNVVKPKVAVENKKATVDSIQHSRPSLENTELEDPVVSQPRVTLASSSSAVERPDSIQHSRPSLKNAESAVVQSVKYHPTKSHLRKS